MEVLTILYMSIAPGSGLIMLWKKLSQVKTCAVMLKCCKFLPLRLEGVVGGGGGGAEVMIWQPLVIMQKCVLFVVMIICFTCKIFYNFDCYAFI